MGLYCFPTNPVLKTRILRESGLDVKYGFLGSYDAIKLGLVGSLIAGVVFVVMVQCLSWVMVYVAVSFGGAAFIGLGVLLILLKST
jgi:hypothetical protein